MAKESVKVNVFIRNYTVERKNKRDGNSKSLRNNLQQGIQKNSVQLSKARSDWLLTKG